MFGKGIHTKAIAVVLCAIGLAVVSASAAQADIRIDDVRVVEGTAQDETSAIFTISRTENTGIIEAFTASTVDGTALADIDYLSRSDQLYFPVGAKTVGFTVAVGADTVFEPDETFGVRLTNNETGPAAISDDLAVGTIVDDDNPTKLAVGNVSVSEGDSGSNSATFTITRSGPTDGPSSVSWSTANLPPSSGVGAPPAGSGDVPVSDHPASAGSDYTAVTNGSVDFAVGETSKTISVPILGDTVAEPDEQFEIRLTSPTGARITDGSGIGTIVNDDTDLKINDVSMTEGDSGTKLATFTITRSGVTTKFSQVYWDIYDGTATSAGSDYVIDFGQVYFVAGETSKQVSVTVRGDTAPEADEMFKVQLSEAGGATLTDATGVGTIVDDDNKFVISDVSVIEGNSGTRQATFTISRPSIGSAKSVSWTTVDGSAKEKLDSDYRKASGNVSFAADETAKTVSVTVNGDTKAEFNETFEVRLSGSGVLIADGTGVGTIINDDTGLVINDVSRTEGNSGSKLATFTITRIGPRDGTSSVSWSTACFASSGATFGGTAACEATAGTDYTAVSSTPVTFAAGEASKTVSVTVFGDTVLEPDERFKVQLASPTGAGIVDGTGVGTILTDETGLSINDVSVTEGNSGTKLATFTITRSGLTSGTSSVRWSTANGTATADSDYTAVSNALVSFAAGETSKTVSVTIAGDTLVEPDETFNVNLSSPTGGAIIDASGVGTIVSDDLPGLSIDDATVIEGNGVIKLATFTITRNNTSIASSVSWAIALTGSADKADLVNPTAKGTVSFEVGEASKTVSIRVNGDTDVEPNETFSVNLSSPFQATIIDGTGVATIVNND